jgi:hypothetical protein
MALGVVTCAKSSASEGGWEVEGVSTSASEGTAAVDACDSSGSSVGVCSPSSASSVSISSTGCVRDGRARPSSSASTNALRRLLRRAARGGKGPGTDCQGN